MERLVDGEEVGVVVLSVILLFCVNSFASFFILSYLASIAARMKIMQHFNFTIPPSRYQPVAS